MVSSREETMKQQCKLLSTLLAISLGGAVAGGAALTRESTKKPNILFIMRDDIASCIRKKFGRVLPRAVIMLL
jgi:hypothetical protein